MHRKAAGDHVVDLDAATVVFGQRLARHLFATRVRADLYQHQVARRMRTSTGKISRLENGVGPLRRLATLYKYARAVGCRLEVRLVPHDWREEDEDEGQQDD